MLSLKKMMVLVGVALMMSLMAACAPAEPETVTVVETVVVEKEVEVVKEVEVEKEVTVVETVEVEVIVDPTACNMDAPADAVEINFIGWSFPIMDHYAEELEKCNAIDNMTVNTQLLDSTSVREQVNLALSGGGDSPYGILHGANGDVVTWANDGYVQPITDLVEKYREEYNLDDIPATVWEGASFNGEIYGVPVVGNTLHFMYNMPLFEEYGLEPPETYDDVIAMCGVLEDEASIDLPFTINLHAGWAWEIEFLHFFRAYGGGNFVDENNMPNINSEAGVQALDKMKEVADACMGDLGLTYGVDDTQIGLQNGSLAAANLWASRAAGLDDPEVSEFVGQIGFSPAPRPNLDGPFGGSAWNDFMFIPATTTVDREVIFKVIMEAADERSQLDAIENGLVTRASVTSDKVRYLDASNETIANGVGIYQANPAVGVIRGKLGEFLPLVGTGEMTAQEALDAAAESYIEEATEQGYIQ